MKKDEVIELLKEQIKELRDDNNRLLDQIDDLIKEVSSLKEALLQKGESLGKQQRLTKGIAKLVSNTSEQQQPPQPALPEEERQKREAEKADKRKARKNNGAKRDMHYEMEQEEHDVYPDDPDFDINKARLVTTAPRICVRYECVPMRFIKHCLYPGLLDKGHYTEVAGRAVRPLNRSRRRRRHSRITGFFADHLFCAGISG